MILSFISKTFINKENNIDVPNSSSHAGLAVKNMEKNTGLTKKWNILVVITAIALLLLILNSADMDLRFIMEVAVSKICFLDLKLD